MGWLLSTLPNSSCTCHTSEPEKAMDIEERLVPLVALPSFRLLNEAHTSATSGGHRAILGNPSPPFPSLVANLSRTSEGGSLKLKVRKHWSR